MRINGVYVRRSRSQVVSKIRRAGLMSPTGRAVTVGPVFANAGVEAWYFSELDKLVTEMYYDARATILPAAEATPAIIAVATDEARPTPNAAGVIFRCGDRFLVLKRTDRMGFWGIPGGGIEAGETPEQAVRRETREETLFDFRGELTYLCTHKYRKAVFATYTAELPDSFIPILNDEHTEYAWATLGEALTMRLHPGLATALTDGSGYAHDATPTKELQRLMEKWGERWVARFDLMSNKLSLEFSARNQRATDTAVKSAFRKAGFTVPIKATRASVEAYKAVAAEQVGLIRSIAQKYHTDVQTQVWESVKRGADLRTLSQKLEKSYGVTRKRAALIARDQNAKAKATIEAVRHQELGIKQAIWMHSHAGKEPRPTHERMNGKLYDLDKGMWDSDEQRYVHPGELINCRCTMRPFIPGFEDAAYPEWEIAQT